MSTVIRGLREDDKLLIVCDSTDDPITTEAPPVADVIVAGEPDGCY